MPHAATRRARICQWEPCKLLMFGNPATRKLAANAPSESSMARNSDFCRKRKMLERRRTTFHSTVTARREPFAGFKPLKSVADGCPDPARRRDQRPGDSTDP